jgi:5'-3' exonuclease
MAPELHLDTSALVYRAFFSLPKTLTDPEGRPINAVRGFLEMVTRLTLDRRPSRIIAAFDDDWRPAYRVEAYAGYKADRPEDPPELPRQFHVLREVLDAVGMPVVIAKGLEADDVLATLAAGASDKDRYLVITGDRDLVALVRDPQVAVVFPVRGLSEVAVFDEAAVIEKYGIPAGLYQDFATMRGDPSDGLPGVAGIGPVRAAKLLNEFGSLDGILGNLDSLPPKQKEAFESARDYLEAMKTVVPMVVDAKIEMSEGHEPDRELIEELVEVHGLGSSPVRLAQALSGER